MDPCTLLRLRDRVSLSYAVLPGETGAVVQAQALLHKAATGQAAHADAASRLADLLPYLPRDARAPVLSAVRGLAPAGHDVYLVRVSDPPRRAAVLAPSAVAAIGAAARHLGSDDGDSYRVDPIPYPLPHAPERAHHAIPHPDRRPPTSRVCPDRQ